MNNLYGEGNDDWKIVGCAVQGRYHIEKDIPCQDKICFEAYDGGVTVVALADGAGSARLSHFGAEAATQAACDKIGKEFHRIVEMRPAEARRTIFDHISGRIRNTASELGCHEHDLWSTLLVAAVDGKRLLTLHIGDGVIGYVKEGRLLMASPPENGEYKNQTFFATAPGGLDHMRLSQGNVGPVSALILMSDGTADTFYDALSSTLRPQLESILRKCVLYPAKKVAQDLQEYFEDNVRMRWTEDDCSIAIMCRPSEHFMGFRDMKGEERRKALGIRTLRAQTLRETILEALAEHGVSTSLELMAKDAAFLGSGIHREELLRALLEDLKKRGLVTESPFRKYSLAITY